MQSPYNTTTINTTGIQTPAIPDHIGAIFEKYDPAIIELRGREADDRLSNKMIVAGIAIGMSGRIYGKNANRPSETIEKTYKLGAEHTLNTRGRGSDKRARQERLIGRVCFQTATLWWDIESARFIGNITPKQAGKLHTKLDNQASKLLAASPDSLELVDHGIELNGHKKNTDTKTDSQYDGTFFIDFAKAIIRQRRTAISALEGKLRKIEKKNSKKLSR